MAKRTSPLAAVLLLILGGLVLVVPGRVRAGQYGETFSGFAEGATDLAPAGELFSNSTASYAMVKDGALKELQLTGFGYNSRSAFRLPALDGNGTRVTAFSAKWNTEIYGTTVSTQFGEGFSFNFGPLGGSSTIFTDGRFNAESGFGAGLSLGVVTGDGGFPGYSVRVNGESVPGGYVAKSFRDAGNFDTTRHFFEVDWSYFTGLTLRVDGVAVFTNLPTPGYTLDAANRFVFGARTGPQGTEQLRLDNIVVATGGTLTPVVAGAPYYTSEDNPPDEDAAKAFDGLTSTKWYAPSTFFPTIGASLAVPKTLRVYAVTSANDEPVRDPGTWTFETSEDGSTWTPRASQGSEYFTKRFEQRAYLIASPVTTSKFQLNIDIGGSENGAQLSELSTWELVPGPAILTVSNLNDSGAGSLRAVLAAAAVTPGPEIITFSPELAGGTIPIVTEIPINDTVGVAIEASNLAGGITLDGITPDNKRVVRLMSNSGAGPLKISGLTFKSGRSNLVVDGDGGAYSTTAATNTTFSRCTFLNNWGAYGGAIVNHGAMVLTGCTVSGNFSNLAGGGIYNDGTLSLSRCTLQGNTTRRDGGGIYNGHLLNLVHCTISGNHTDYDGGGVDNFDGDVTLTNTIIAGNETYMAVPNDMESGRSNNQGPVAHIIRKGTNIVQIFSEFNGATDSIVGPEPLTADPLLAPLGNYGGFSKTMALKRGSPARNASGSSGSTLDQRGIPMTGIPDLGAYEAGISTMMNYDSWIWETLPAAASTADHAADADYDHDGWANQSEWASLTDPIDAKSYFKLATFGRVGPDYRISYPTVVGRNYTFQYSYDMATWQTSVVTAGTGAAIQNSIPVAGHPTMFVRVLPGM
jgi:hypothetical protein